MIDPRTKFGHPMAYVHERPSVVDAEWEAQMGLQVDAIFDDGVSINWWR